MMFLEYFFMTAKKNKNKKKYDNNMKIIKVAILTFWRPTLNARLNVCFKADFCCQIKRTKEKNNIKQNDV